MILRSLGAIGLMVSLAWCGAATHSAIQCAFSSGGTFVDFGPSACHHYVAIDEQNLEDCPCRASGKIRAEGPFSSTFTTTVSWGGPFGGSGYTLQSPIAAGLNYDIDLSCGESYTIEMSCALAGAASYTFYRDKGECNAPCEE